ncbi:hypothetical protein BSU04_25150 [Caballeronia sordidicola]|uniref:Uncharacterized protein n=1 Tax=Caballeronia sordidicola TaxID=196367 RepID=A0A226WYG9_CABSO|nr:hypothetical protein BSU04_25150 [Caballeronia sordidicola]
MQEAGQKANVFEATYPDAARRPLVVTWSTLDDLRFLLAAV